MRPFISINDICRLTSNYSYGGRNEKKTAASQKGLRRRLVSKKPWLINQKKAKNPLFLGSLTFSSTDQQRLETIFFVKFAPLSGFQIKGLSDEEQKRSDRLGSAKPACRSARGASRQRQPACQTDITNKNGQTSKTGQTSNIGQANKTDQPTRLANPTR
jgi:hypothetical protein